MGIRIVSKSVTLTLRDLSEFLYHLDNIYKAEFFLKTERTYRPYFYRQRLKDYESLYVARIEERSPLHLIVVPSLPYRDIIYTLTEIIKIVIELKARQMIEREYSSRQRRELLRYEVKRELEIRRLMHDDLVVEETVKLTESRVDLESVELDEKTFEDYFNRPPPKDNL